MKLRRHVLMLAAVGAGITAALIGAPTDLGACGGGQYQCYNIQFDWELGCAGAGNECLGCCLKKTE